MDIEGWKRKRERHMAWWRHELNEPLIIAAAPRTNHSAPLHNIEGTTYDREFDSELVVKHMENHIYRTYFGGDALPIAYTCLSAINIALFCGAEPIYGHTVWVKRCIDDLYNYPTPHFDINNKYIELTRRKIDTLVKASEGRWLVSCGDPTDCLTMLGEMRGAENLAIDLVDSQEEVLRVLGGMKEVWFGAYDLFKRTIRAGGQEGTADWLGLWHPGRYCTIQCDFSVLISPEMFNRFVMPELKEEATYLDKCAYHMDGPGELRHLDILLATDEIDAIQWFPGDANPGITHWYDLVGKMQKAGKNVIVYARLDEVKDVLDNLQHKGLCINVTDLTSEEQARSLIASLPFDLGD